jgi:hypothetical protein
MEGTLCVRKPDIQQVFQAGGCLLCVFLALRNTDGLEGTEFSGGWLTGPLLSMEDIGTCPIAGEESPLHSHRVTLM